MEHFSAVKFAMGYEKNWAFLWYPNLKKSKKLKKSDPLTMSRQCSHLYSTPIWLRGKDHQKEQPKETEILWDVMLLKDSLHHMEG